MAYETVPSEIEHISPELRLLKARRVIRLVRLLMMAAITFLASIALWIFQYAFHATLFPIGSVGPFAVYPILLGIGTIGLLIPTQLELGSSTENWAALYRQARAVTDADQAQRRERVPMSDMPTYADDPVPNSDEAQIAAPSLTSIRTEADLRETARWEVTNYPALTRSIIERLQAEIATQGGRANINLGIALIVASVGIVILGWLSWNALYMLQNPPQHGNDTTMLYAGAFTAKLALALTANVFAFFLATYRRNLSEIRYFHNELTNVQTRVLALYIAADRKLSVPLGLAIKGLSVTERNFILRKGESTTDLSLKGLDSAEVSNLLTMMKEMAQVTKRS